MIYSRLYTKYNPFRENYNDNLMRKTSRKVMKAQEKSRILLFVKNKTEKLMKIMTKIEIKIENN